MECRGLYEHKGVKAMVDEDGRTTTLPKIYSTASTSSASSASTSRHSSSSPGATKKGLSDMTVGSRDNRRPSMDSR